MALQKYWVLLKLSWQTGFVYRTNVILWRFRQFLSTLMALTVWQVIFSQQGSAFNYSGAEMTTYIFLAAFLQSFILATALNGLANRIYSGQFSFDLLKPINLYAYLGTEDLADKLKNVGFLVVETIILWFIFRPELSVPGWEIGALFAFWLAGGILLNFLVTLLFGAMGFWSPDVWGPRFLFFIFVEFTAGKLFPLDILPELIQRIILWTPFPFFAFLQSQLFLEKLSSAEVWQYSGMLIFWIVLFALVVSAVWKRGIRNYDAAGQ